jgi:hypothetical protein
MSLENYFNKGSSLVEGFGGEIPPLPGDQNITSAIKDTASFTPPREDLKYLIEKLLLEKITINELAEEAENAFISKAQLFDGTSHSFYEDSEGRKACLYCNKHLTLKPLPEKGNSKWVLSPCDCPDSRKETLLIEDFLNVYKTYLDKLDDWRKPFIKRFIKEKISNECVEYKQTIESSITKLIQHNGLLSEIIELIV